MQRFQVRRNRVTKILNAEVARARRRTSILLKTKISQPLPDLNLIKKDEKSYAED